MFLISRSSRTLSCSILLLKSSSSKWTWSPPISWDGCRLSWVGSQSPIRACIWLWPGGPWVGVCACAVCTTAIDADSTIIPTIERMSGSSWLNRGQLVGTVVIPGHNTSIFACDAYCGGCFSVTLSANTWMTSDAAGAVSGDLGGLRMTRSAASCLDRLFAVGQTARASRFSQGARRLASSCKTNASRLIAPEAACSIRGRARG